MAGKRSAISTYNTVKRDSASQAVMNEFARRLQAAMQMKGWNQSELARACDKLLPKPSRGQIQNLKFGRDTISHYVRGVSMPRPERLVIIAQALGVEQDDLVPPLGVPSVGGDRPAFQMQSAGDGRVFLSVNRTMTLKNANRIIEILGSEDAK